MKKCKLGEILDVKRGASLSGKYYSEDGDLVRLTLGNFNYPNGGFKENTSKKDLYFVGPIKSEFILKKGDIITPLTEQVAGLLGETAKIPEDNKYIQSGDIGLVIPKSEVLHPNYAYYLVASDGVKKQLGAGAQQTKIRHTSPDKIKDCTVWLPDLDYQKSASHILDLINDKIKYNSKINKELEDMIKTIYNYWFLQFNYPGSKSKSKIYNEKLKAEIPEDWNITKIKDIIDEKNKSLIQVGEAKNNDTGKFPFFTSGDDVYRFDEKLIDGMNCYLSTGGKSNVKFYNGEAAYSTDTWCFSGKNNLEIYLYMWISSLGDIFDKKYFAGTGLKHLQKDLFRNTYITVPNTEELKKFNNIAYPAFAKISENLKENYELNNLKSYITPLIINGQVKFKKEVD